MSNLLQPTPRSGAATADSDPHVFLLDGSRGALFAAYFAPTGTPHPAGDILVVPPFAEEMNRCRAMVTLQARALAHIGIGTLVVDPYGTGDSAGDFAEATWDTWRDDLTRGLAWLRQHGQGCASLWGIRLGTLMATELAQQDGGIERLLLWQPVLNGKLFYTQFLRIRLAAEMELPNRVKTTQELRQKSESGETIEVSGYAIHPALARALDGLELSNHAALSRLQTDWFEVLTSAESSIPRANAKAAADFEAAGAAITVHTVIGPPFWHVHERELAPELIAATSRCLGAWGRPGRPSASASANPLPDRAASGPPDAEVPLTFACGSDRLAAMLHRPATAAAGTSKRGVVIVVAGGPQYRAGAHRQFVSLARKLAASGFPVLRFDLRGMGDSSGSYVGFQESEADIRCAIDALLAREPQLDEVVLLGECESASGILFYAWRDVRVKGAVLVNPWVRTEEGQAQVIIKHYYLDRLRSKEFWRLVRSGKFDIRASLSSLADVVRAYVRGKKLMAQAHTDAASDDISGLPLPVKTAVGLRRFTGRSLLLMSGHDYIAREFDEVTAASTAWNGLLADPRVVRCDIEGADHTFSRAAWKEAASDAVVSWMRKW